MVEIFIPRRNDLWQGGGVGRPLPKLDVTHWLLDTLGEESHDSCYLYDEYDWSIADTWMSSDSLGPGEFCRMRFGSTNAAVMFKLRWL